MLAGTDGLKTSPPVEDQRRHRGYNRVVFLLYLHYRPFTGDRLSVELWELCTLFCQSNRQVGAKQNGLLESVLGLFCLSIYGISLLLSFTLESHWRG